MAAPSLSLTFSPAGMSVVEGWNAGFQASLGIGGQGGYSFQNSPGPFVEIGGGSPGLSLTGFYVFSPFANAYSQ